MEGTSKVPSNFQDLGLFQVLRICFGEFLHLRATYPLNVWILRMLWVVVLVVFLGQVKGSCGGNFCSNRTVVLAGIIEFFLVSAGLGSLLFVEVKHARAVLGAYIRPLPIDLRRIMTGIEKLQQ